MKPIIHYTLVRPIWIGKYSIMGVTSISRYNRVNGRMIDNDEPTHRRKSECIGEFETIEQAQSIIDKMEKIRKDYSERINALYKRVEELRNEQSNEINKVIQNAHARNNS